MGKMTITLAYETNEKSNLIEFNPVSYSRLKNKDFTFGVPQRIKRIIEMKSFKLIEVTCKHYDGLTFQFTDMGYSVDQSNLFFHFKTF